jgi:hypothetical protein
VRYLNKHTTLTQLTVKTAQTLTKSSPKNNHQLVKHFQPTRQTSDIIISRIIIMARVLCLLAVLSAISSSSSAFVIPSASRAPSLSLLHEESPGASLADRELEEPGRNPDRPELPELKGDFDWDQKFGGDDDWIVENVPGKIVLSELEIAKQVTALEKLETKWRKERQIEEWEADKRVGFVNKAELLNGRTAMFFLVTGLLTELWTGMSMPGQVEEMLRIGGFIGYD